MPSNGTNETTSSNIVSDGMKPSARFSTNFDQGASQTKRTQFNRKLVRWGC